MPSPSTATHPILETFCHAALRVLIRAEIQERVSIPVRFTGIGPDIWNTFHNELTTADLLVLAIQDVSANMPIPFDPQAWLYPENSAEYAPTWSEFQIDPELVQTWLSEAKQTAALPLDSYFRAQAELLKISPPVARSLEKLPLPQKHERWLELPGTGGWIAYTLTARSNRELYLWENFTILCATPQEMILAGLIAWELDAPPNIELPILYDDANLTKIMGSSQVFHNVMGKRTEHGHRDLRFLHQENKHPLWL